MTTTPENGANAQPNAADQNPQTHTTQPLPPVGATQPLPAVARHRDNADACRPDRGIEGL